MATKNSKPCTVAGCGRTNTVRGLCHRHLMQLRRKGTVDPTRRQMEDRFWSKVDVRGPDECWLWRGWRNQNGHGQFSLDGQRRMPAHVVAWVLTHGRPLPASKPCGLHRCDNPPCCNPAHVFPGTNRDNIADRHSKRRDAKGDYHGMTKIPEAAIPVIRQRLASGERIAAVALDYGVAYVTIQSIKSGVRRGSHAGSPS